MDTASWVLLTGGVLLSVIDRYASNNTLNRRTMNIFAEDALYSVHLTEIQKADSMAGALVLFFPTICANF